MVTNASAKPFFPAEALIKSWGSLMFGYSLKCKWSDRMKKVICLLIIVIITLSSCSNIPENMREQSASNSNTNLTDNNPANSTSQLSISSIETMNTNGKPLENKILSLERCVEFIGEDFEHVTENLNSKYKTVLVGIIGKDQGYYFEDVNLYFYFNGLGKLQYLQADSVKSIYGHQLGVNFESIQKTFGSSELEKYSIRDDGYIHENYGGEENLFALSYKIGNVKIKFVSHSITGENYKVFIYCPGKFTRIDQIVTELHVKNFNKIVEIYGNDYILSGEYDEDFPWWKHYEATGLFYEDFNDANYTERSIKLDKDVKLNGITSGMMFSEIMNVMGKTRIYEEIRYMVENTQFFIKYSFGKYFIEASSGDNKGTDSNVRIALDDPKYKMRVFDNFDWKFKNNEVWLDYNGKEYLITKELNAVWWPVYYETDYAEQNIPNDAIGACIPCITAIGEIDCIYLKKVNSELVFYKRLSPHGEEESNFNEFLRINVN